MDLTEFSNLTLDTPNAAKNFLSFMLGYKFPDNIKSEKAIRNLFYSFPESFRQEKKLFEPMIEKFFGKYPINKDNIELFNTYITKQEMQTYIKEKNPNWDWGNKPLELASFTAYLASFNATCNAVKTKEAKAANAYRFIADNSQALHNFVKADKKKVESLGIKKDFFLFLVEDDYSKFKEICDEYGFDRFNILNGYYGAKSYYGLGKYFFTTRDLTVHDYKVFFDDVLEKPELLLKNNNFIKGESITKDSSKFELPYYFCAAIHNKQYDKATLLMECFKDNLIYLLNDLSHNITRSNDKKQVVTLKYPELTEALLESFADTVDYTNKNYHHCPYRFSKSDIPEFINYINVIRQYEKLENNIPQKQETKAKLKL